MNLLFKIEQMFLFFTSLYRAFLYRSVDKIAADAWGRLSDAERQEFRNIHNKDDMIRYHHVAGRWIRNFYGLWNPRNRLTRKYFIDGDKYVKGGINFHPDHPDAVSSRILDKMWEISRAK
jgi:hypothetical protein